MRTEDGRELRFLSKFWIFFPLVIAFLGLSVVTVLTFTTWKMAETRNAVESRSINSLNNLISQRLQALFKNDSVIALSNALSTIENVSFPDIENKVAPKLFMVLSTLPLLSEVSYVGLDGLVFSYLRDAKDSVNVLFANSSISLNNIASNSWYTQPANSYTGDLLGDAVETELVNEPNWLHNVMNGKGGDASIGTGWFQANEGKKLFFISPVSDTGFVSVGISLSNLHSEIANIDLHGAQLYLAAYGPPLSINDLPQQCDWLFVSNSSNLHSEIADSVVGEDCIAQCNRCMSSCLGSPGINSYRRGVNMYKTSCCDLEVSGIQLVGLVVTHHNGLVEILNIIAIIMASTLIVGVGIGGFFLHHLSRRSQAQIDSLQLDLVKQTEALQQAERKSMNKSMAFARSNHDVRSSLAVIIGLIDTARADTHLSPEMAHNLGQMEVCANKLLGILNCILDTSKVESGKMQLKAVEFDIAKVIEESVDMFYVVGRKKNLEVIWDPCDLSVLKSRRVIGDKERFQQILDNLLGNAVKYTSEGSIILRCWANTAVIRSSKVYNKFKYPKSKGFGSFFFGFMKDRKNMLENNSESAMQPDTSYIEFYFEVDDTGIGIPKEKRDSVFEDYVQVKDVPTKVKGEPGTGLGLGIVQSFVRLMGGEIDIKDKEPGEPGTCFRFNTYLKSSDLPCDELVPEFTLSQSRSAVDIEMGKVESSESQIWSLVIKKEISFRGVHSVLQIHGSETTRVLQTWLENLSIKVRTIQNIQILCSVVEKMESIVGSPEKLDSALFYNSRSLNNGSTPERCFISGIRNSRRASSGGGNFSVLVIVDISDGDTDEIYSEMRDFVNNNPCIPHKIVFLVDFTTTSDIIGQFRSIPHDLVLRKPIHGSRLLDILRVLQSPREVPEYSASPLTINNSVPANPPSPQAEILPVLQSPSEDTVGSKPFFGMHFLVVEDNQMLRFLARNMLSQLGGTAEFAENGVAALQYVNQAIGNRKQDMLKGEMVKFQYDAILMDCEMPEMNGYDATRNIREEEKQHSFHVPIIALTANSTPEEENKSILAGMDAHITKPLNHSKLVDTVLRAREKYKNQ